MAMRKREEQVFPNSPVEAIVDEANTIRGLPAKPLQF